MSPLLEVQITDMENPMNISKMTGFALLAVSTASAQNLLSNADFESGIDGWITFNNVEASTEVAFDGVGAAKLFNPFNGEEFAGSVLEQSTSCEPGQAYQSSVMTLLPSFDAMSADSGNFFVTQIRFLDGAGNTLALGAADSAQLNASSPQDTWTELTCAATAPPDAATVKVISVFVSPNGDEPNVSGSVFVDGYSLSLAESACSTAEFENPSFESGLECWDVFGTNVFESNLFARTGSASVSVSGETDAGGENYSGFFQDITNVSAGDVVTFSGYYYSDPANSIVGTAGQRAVIKFDGLPFAGGPVYGFAGEEVVISSDGGVEGEWLPISFTATVPADYAGVRAAIVFVGSNGQSGSVYFDDMEVCINCVESPCSDEALQNASFEEGTLECWGRFGNNIYVEDTYAQDGTYSAKMFGNFFDVENYTGLTQTFTNVAVGDELSISAWGYTPSNDSIANGGNRVVVKWDFTDANGAQIFGADTPLLDGADANTPEDQWVQATNLNTFPQEAAGGTATAVVLFFQPASFDGGAVWVDNVEVLINGEEPTDGGGGDPGPDPCPCDVDNDTICGFGDVLAVLSDWQGTDTDVDGDGTVGFGDVLAVLSNWGPCDKTP